MCAYSKDRMWSIARVHGRPFWQMGFLGFLSVDVCLLIVGLLLSIDVAGGEKGESPEFSPSLFWA